MLAHFNAQNSLQTNQTKSHKKGRDGFLLLLLLKQIFSYTGAEIHIIGLKNHTGFIKRPKTSKSVKQSIM